MVGFSLFQTLTRKWQALIFLEHQRLELMWTVLPMLILILLAFPSLLLLYWYDDLSWKKNNLNLKIVGHQWYWTYGFEDLEDKEMRFDSYIIRQKRRVERSRHRLLDVDNRLRVNCLTTYTLLLTSEDVIHSWALPRLRVKLDATPGRLTSTRLSVSNTGVNYGQCSEICGANHSFMPIVLESHI